MLWLSLLPKYATVYAKYIYLYICICTYTYTHTRTHILVWLPLRENGNQFYWMFYQLLLIIWEKWLSIYLHAQHCRSHAGGVKIIDYAILLVIGGTEWPCVFLVVEVVKMVTADRSKGTCFTGSGSGATALTYWSTRTICTDISRAKAWIQSFSDFILKAMIWE